jgi:hypothetical protein
MPKKYGWIIIGSVIAAIALPLAIDWLIIGNSFPSNISNSDWVGFLGGYIGAIIGAVVSLVGIVITIRYTNEQNREDRELQVRPYCMIRYVPTPKTISTKKELGCFMLGCEPKENNGPRYQSVIYIKNIGLGPAIEFEFDVDDIDDGREHYPILPQRTSETANNAVNLLQPGEEAIIPVSIWFNFDPIKEEDLEIIEDAPLGKYHIKHNVLSKYKNFDIIITVKYCDMYQNEYSQKVKLSSNMHASITQEGKAKHLCDINLKETTVPVKIGKRKKNSR